MPSIHPTASSDIILISPPYKGVVPAWFQPEYWQTQNKLLHTASGRGTVWFIETPTENAVLRQYRRGGLIAKFNAFNFLAQPIEQSRAFKELALLEKLAEFELPAPRPIAGLVRRKGLFYQAWLMTKVIANADDLYEILQQRPLSQHAWRQIGHTIRRFHDKNVYHSDLNCHNILLDQADAVWLIDFDKCSLKSAQGNWKKANLDRLLRSFEKECGKCERFEFDASAWQHLLDGYHTP